MALILIVLFVIGPIAEIYVLLAAGGTFGVWPVVGACVATAVIGGIILRLQGLAALQSAQRDISTGKAPVEAVADGVFLVIAAPFLMTPGFITDVIGFSLLIPPVRHWLARQVLGRLRQSMAEGKTGFTVRKF